MQSPGSSFLHERNPNLHASIEVESVASYLRAGGEVIPNEPADKISAYLGFLAHPEYVNDGILTGDQASIDRQVESASISLTKENAEAYVKFQVKVARELGRGGEFDPDKLDDNAKMAALRLVRKDQQQQLGGWVQELNSGENNYPNWFKYWMFSSVTKHTAFNDDIGKSGQPKGFEKRSGSSFALFPELDRESVSLVYDALTEKLGGQPMGFEYANMRKLLATANFGLLYGEAQNYGFKITDRLKSITTGSWHDFSQSDHKADAQALSSLVRSYRTGWCTAGSETAQVQLSNGDFYVWCSTNPDTGKDEVPRIAVRMENGTVVEVRGIVGGRRQELESELADTAIDKIKDLPGGDSYFHKAECMKRLTAIEKKVAAQSEVELSDEELRFLYEVDREIEGFGYDADPRIAEIRALRGDRDKPEIIRLLPESVREQIRAAYSAYKTVAEKLGVVAAAPAELEALFVAKDAEWQTNGVYDYLLEQFMENGNRFKLVATPNIEVDEARIVALAEDFGKEQPSQTNVNDKLYRKNQYSGHEWSGNYGNTPIRLSLIQTCADKNLSYRNAEDQLRLLRLSQSEYPVLQLRVPSLLDAVAYWYSLRAQGEKLQDMSTFRKTFIRHFDLEAKAGITLYGSVAPSSTISFDGQPFLTYSATTDELDARLAMG